MEASAFGIDKSSTCKTVAVKMLKGTYRSEILTRPLREPVGNEVSSSQLQTSPKFIVFRREWGCHMGAISHSTVDVNMEEMTSGLHAVLLIKSCIPRGGKQQLPGLWGWEGNRLQNVITLDSLKLDLSLRSQPFQM